MDERQRAEANRRRGSAARIAGRFEVRGLLGEGPSAKVYRVLDHGAEGGAERTATLKILRADALGDEVLVEGLVDGAEALRELDHARIQHVLDVGQTDLGLVYFESEYADGENLRALLARRGTLPRTRALEIARQILAALEFGHSHGVPHGALHAGNVLLLDRVPFDEDNPWAVGVRLLDYGIAGLLGAATGAPADFDALEALYREMVGDDTAKLAFDMGAADAPAPERKPQPGPTAAAKGPPPPMRRVEQHPHAGRGYVLPGALALLAFVLFVLWMRERGDDPVVRAEVPAEVEELRAQLELERGRTRLAGETLERDRGADAERALALQGKVDGLVGEVERWKTAGREARQRADGLERSLATATSEKQELERYLASEEAELRQARERLTETRLALDLVSDPELLAADYLERAIAALEEGDPVAARAHFEAWSADRTFEGIELTGMDFVDALTACAAGLATAGTDALARVDGLMDAGAAAERARALQATLVDAAWMNRDGGSGSGIDRTGRLARERESVDARLRADRAALSKTLDARWRRIVFEHPDREPREVLAIADWFGDGRLEEFLAWYAGFLSGAIETGDGLLDLPALFQQRHLDAWGDALAARPDASGSHAAREVLLVRYARAWEDAPPGAGAPPYPVFFQASDGGPLTGWRSRLRLRARMLAEDSAFPGPAGSRFLYKTTAAPEGGTASSSWRLDEVESVERDPGALEDGVLCAWVILQRFYREDGSYLSGRRVRFLQRGKAIHEEGRPEPVLDLTAGTLGFPSHLLEEVHPAPARLPVGAADHDAFRAAFLGVDWRCAVVVDDLRTSWYSPDWGRLWVDDPTRVSLELVYASIARD